MNTMEQAARARADAMTARRDRPRERRMADIPGAPARIITRSPMGIVVRQDGGDGVLGFTGYASVTDRGYDMWDFFGPYVEKVVPGAFADTLRTDNLDVPLVLDHDSMRRIARTTNGTLSLAEDETGLRADAEPLDPADADVAYITPKLRSGLIDEMSFRFAITSGEWSADWTEFHIHSVDINRGDVSIVGYGANPYTTASLREAVARLTRGDATERDIAVVASSGAVDLRALHRRNVDLDFLSVPPAPVI